MDTQLEAVRDWAKAKIAAGQEPPWAWYQYMKLIEALDAVLEGQRCAVTRERSPRAEQRPDVHLRLVDSSAPQDSAPLLLDTSRVQLPM